MLVNSSEICSGHNKIHMEHYDFNWITSKEAMRLLGIGRTKLWQLCRSHVLIWSKPSKRVYVRLDSIERYLERHSTTLGQQ